MTEELYRTETGEYLMQKRVRAYTRTPAPSLVKSYEQFLVNQAQQKAKKYAPLKDMTRAQKVTFLSVTLAKPAA